MSHWFKERCDQDPDTCEWKRGEKCENPVSDCLWYEKIVEDVRIDKLKEDYDE